LFEWTFFLLLFLAILSLAFGFVTRSPILLVVAGVLFFSHAVLGLSEGVERFDGLSVNCVDANCDSFDVNSVYVSTTVQNDSGFWAFSMVELLIGFVVVGLGVGIKVGWWRV